MEQVFIAMLVDNFLYPISAIRSHFSQSIDWSGIRYHLKDGKISTVCSKHCFFSIISVLADYRAKFILISFEAPTSMENKVVINGFKGKFISVTLFVLRWAFSLRNLAM